MSIPHTKQLYTVKHDNNFNSKNAKPVNWLTVSHCKKYCWFKLNQNLKILS